MARRVVTIPIKGLYTDYDVDIALAHIVTVYEDKREKEVVVNLTDGTEYKLSDTVAKNFLLQWKSYSAGE